MRRAAGFLLLNLLLAPAAAAPLAIDAGADEYGLIEHTEYWRTQDLALDIEQVSDPQMTGRFAPSEGGRLYFGYDIDNVWLRFTLRPTAGALDRDWVLDLDNALLDEVRLYARDAQGRWQSQGSGYDTPMSQRLVRYRTPAFALPLTRAPEQTFYLRIHSNGSRRVPIKLFSRERFTEAISYSELASGLFFGALFIMLAYNLFLYFELRDLTYLIYTASMLCSGLFQASLSGHGLWALWPEQPALSDPVSLVALIGTIGFGNWFGMRFLDLRRALPAGLRIMQAVIVAIFLLVPLYLTLGYGPAIRAGAFVSMAAGPVALVIGVLAWLRGQRTARFYVIAWLGYTIGAAFAASRQLGLAPDTFLTTYGFRIGTVLEAVLLSFALSDRYNQMRLEKLAAERHQQQTEASRNLIRRYVPPAVAESIISGHEADIAEPQRRRVTVLFSDIVGFTGMADRLDAESLTQILNEYMATMAGIVEAHNGTLNEFAGDGLMALFGAPKELSPEDQVFNAVSAAQQMQAKIPDLNQAWLKLGIGEPLKIRIGINTGVLSVGSFGSQGRMTYTAIGLQTNIAARIQSHCEPGGVLLSDASWHLVKDRIACEPKGEVECKGVHFPVKVHAPAASLPVPSAM